MPIGRRRFYAAKTRRTYQADRRQSQQEENTSPTPYPAASVPLMTYAAAMPHPTAAKASTALWKTRRAPTRRRAVATTTVSVISTPPPRQLTGLGRRPLTAEFGPSSSGSGTTRNSVRPESRRAALAAEFDGDVR